MAEIRLNPIEILRDAIERVGPVFVPVALLTLPGIVIPYILPPALAVGANVIYVLLIAPILGGASIILINRCLNGQQTSLSEALAMAWRRAVPLIVSVLMLLVILIPAMALFVIPGLYLSVRLFAVQYGVVLENQSPLEALSMSWELTKGRWGQIFLALLLISLAIVVPIMVLSVLLASASLPDAIVNLLVPAVTPPLMMALLMIYRLLKGQKTAEEQPA